MSIKSKIQALISAANTKTGESDTTLTDAVQTLVDGYGQGGGSLDGLVMHTGEVTVLTPVADITITHGFTEAPVVLVVYPKETIPSNPQNNIIGAAFAYSGNSIIHSVKNLPATSAQSPQPTGSRIGWYTTANRPNGAGEVSQLSYIKSVTATEFVFGGSGNYPVFNTTYVWRAYAFEGSGS